MLFNATLIGNLAEKPELKVIDAEKGTQVVNLRCAVNRQYSKGEGNNRERVTETTWWNIAVWGHQAKACADWLDKGSLVSITMDRSPEADAYLTRDGQPGAALKATASRVQFLSSNNTDGGGGHSDNVAREAPPSDDIPF